MKKFVSQKGFTLIEVMMTLAILSILAGVALKMFRNGADIWNAGMAQIQLQSEARMSMMSITKFIHECQGGTIKISRYDTSQPVDSAIRAKLAETAYVTDDNPQAHCGCQDTSVTNAMGGDAGQDFRFYQQGDNLIYAYPNPVTAASTDVVTFNTVKLATDLDFINFTFDDSTDGSVVVVTARFSRVFYANKPARSMLIKRSVVIKHFHAAGFYAN
jgi:prepilin-type N-terminal cleavage/methylation domain-containing protein